MYVPLKMVLLYDYSPLVILGAAASSSEVSGEAQRGDGGQGSREEEAQGSGGGPQCNVDQPAS
jgi:hypothetical protein